MNVRNYIHLTGNLGAAPKTVILQSGTVATEFPLATNEYYRDKDGNRQTSTEWHRIKAYGKLAELFTEHLKRGSQISVVGSMRYRKWTDKFEQQRSTAEVVVEDFTFLSSSSRQSSETTNDAALADTLVGGETPRMGRSAQSASGQRGKQTAGASLSAE